MYLVWLAKDKYITCIKLPPNETTAVKQTWVTVAFAFAWKNEDVDNKGLAWNTILPEDVTAVNNR